MTIDELDALNEPRNQGESYDLLAAAVWGQRRAVRDAFLDLAEEMDAKGETIVAGTFTASRAFEIPMLLDGYIRDYDHG
jgi:hypothetical protein